MLVLGLLNTLIIHFLNEWIALRCVHFGLCRESSLLRLNLGFVRKSVLMQYFVFLLHGLEPVLILSVISQLRHHSVLVVLSFDRLIFNLNLHFLALFHELLLLLLSFLSLGACFQVLCGILSLHGFVCIQILSLEFDLFEFLGKSLLF